MLVQIGAAMLILCALTESRTCGVLALVSLTAAVLLY
jgi:hypothetical protein